MLVGKLCTLSTSILSNLILNINATQMSFDILQNTLISQAVTDTLVLLIKAPDVLHLLLLCHV